VRDLVRLPQQRSKHAADRDTTVVTNADERRGRQMPLGGIRDDPKCREGQIVGSGDARRHMRFHVGGDGACRNMQRPLAGRVDYWQIDACHVDDRGITQRFGDPLRPGVVAFEILSVLGDDPPRHQRRAGAHSRREAAGDSETDNGGNIGAYSFFERNLKTLTIAAARNDNDVRSRRDTGLCQEAGDGEDCAFP
jgi:hypothetical protein